MNNEGCKLCGGTNTAFYKESEKVLKCQQCGIVFLAPGQINYDLGSYYESNVFYADNATNPTLINWMIRSALFYLRVITKYVVPVKSNILVDVGSNYGALVEEASKLGFEAIGLEKNSILAEKSKARGLNILTCNLADLNTPVPVKVISAMHVLEHLDDPRAFIKDAYKKLSKDGFLFIAVPDVDSYLAQKDGLSWRYFALEHLFYFSKHTLAQLLLQEGFEAVAFKRDNTNLADQGVKKLLHYLWGKPLTRDRFQAKSYEGRKQEFVPPKKLVKVVLKKLILFIIKALGRGDFIMVVAKKTK